MCLVAVKQPYVLQILYDDDAKSTRKDRDNFGKMIAWHSRYNLGDKHDYTEPNEFLRALTSNSVSAEDIVQYVRDGNTNEVKLEYDRSTRKWVVSSYDEYLKEWFIECVFEGTLKDGLLELADGIVSVLNNQDLLHLSEKKNCILELHLYDHSGLSMSSSSFHGRAQHAQWDSGQVGWIYASHEDVKKEYGSISHETIEKAENLLRSEIKDFDFYLSNQCYGFVLYENGAKIDSCWGFLGYIEDVKQEIACYLPEECQDMVDNMKDSFETNINFYLYNYPSLEGEEMEALA